MKKNVLAVVAAAGLWHTAAFANLQPDGDMIDKAPLTTTEVTFQPMQSVTELVAADPFALTSEGSYVIGSHYILIDIGGKLYQINLPHFFWWDDDDLEY